MDSNERELYASRIMAGKIGIKIDGKTHFISVPDPYDKYVAQEIFFSSKRDAGFHGIFTEEDVQDIMIQKNLWTDDEQDELEGLPKRIENLKVALYESMMKEKIFKATRKTLDKEKKRHEELSAKKTSMNNFTQTGVANTIKLQYLLYTSIVNKKGEYKYDGDEFWDEEHKVIEDIFKTYLSAQVREEVIRELARTEPWRSYWGAAKTEGSVFGKSASELNAEQRSLINWSKFYDSIQEHMEAPTDEVIQDDDLLDGWLILQNRKREREKLEKEVDKKIGKNKGAQEVYVMADSQEHADKIHSLNNPMARNIVKQRERQMDAAGEKGIFEQDLSDAKQRMKNQAYQQRKKR